MCCTFDDTHVVLIHYLLYTEMDSDRVKQPFPVARFVDYSNFHYYYAYGNTPAEDFLRSLNKLEEPNILLLGCGDLRSCFYTIWKNFRSGIDDRFNGVHLVLNDYSSAIIARDVLFIRLCLKMPQGNVAAKKWISALWAIWFCHELRLNHKKVLEDGLDELIELSQSPLVWASTKNSLSKVVHFTSPNTLRAVRHTWIMWRNQDKNVISVEQMHEDRLAQQELKIPNIESMVNGVVSDLLTDTITSEKSRKAMKDETLCYVQSGNAFAEDVVGMPVVGSKSVVNSTFYERRDGKYTLHYASVPFKCFFHSCQFRKKLMPSLATDQLLVEDASFAQKPLLSNSVQQFTMWLKTCANVLKDAACSHDSSCITFNFHLSDAVEFCLTLQSAPLSASLSCQTPFDAVFTSNLIDHVGVSNLVLTVLPLLSPSGRLFTTSLLYKVVALVGEEYLQTLFGVDITLFPVLFGVRCINHEGSNYSSEVSKQPVPVQFGHLVSSYQSPKDFIWEKTLDIPLKHPSLLENSNVITKNLCQAICTAATSLVTPRSKGQSAINLLCTETVMKMLLTFVERVDGDVDNYLFWKPLCSLLLQQEVLKPFMYCVQTQALLHKIHLHLNVNRDTCPLCQEVPLTDSIGQFSVEIRNRDWRDTPSFLIFLHKPSITFRTAYELQMIATKDPTIHIINSINGVSTGNGLVLDFFLPLTFLSDEHNFTVVSYGVASYKGSLPMSFDEFNYSYIVSSHTLTSAFNCSNITYLFNSVKVGFIPPSSFGTIRVNSGDGNTFETVVLLKDETLDSIKHSSLLPRQISFSSVELSAGPHKCLLHYPYPVDYNSMSIKISRTQKTVTVLVTRIKHAFETELPIFMFNPSDKLSMPRIPVCAEVMDRYTKMQFTKRDRDSAARCKGEYALKSPLTNLKETLVVLFTAQEENVFQISLGGPSLDIHALIIVEDRLFDLEHRTPVVQIAFCFLNFFIGPTVSEGWIAMNAQQGRVRVRNIHVDEKELKLLEAALNYFTLCTVKSDVANTKHLRHLKQHKILRYFKEAVVHPLYSDPDSFAQGMEGDRIIDQIVGSNSSEQNIMKGSQCQNCGNIRSDLINCAACGDARYCDENCQKKHWEVHKNKCKSSGGDERDSSKQQLLKSRLSSDCDCCDFCDMKSTTLKKCGACRKMQYCSKDCQTKDWKKHKLVCATMKNINSQDRVGGGAFSTHQTDVVSKCSGCGKESNTLRQCPCHTAAYCNTKCQRMDWTRHKANCIAH